MQNCFESNANDKLEWKTVQLEGRYGITMEYWINTMVWLVTQSPTFWSKVKGALRSTTASKASGCDEIPAELFKSLKDDAIKILHSMCQQIWKTQQWPQDQKR